MAIRTTAAAVQAVLLNEYDTINIPDLTTFIATASSIVDDLHAADTAGVVGTTKLERIECYLACHFFKQTDQMTSARTTNKVSGTFQGQTQMGFDYTPYGQTAKQLDNSRYLVAMDKGGFIRADWLGGYRPPDESDYIG